MSTYDFNIETKDGASHGLMEGQPALPERGDILQMWGQQGQAVYWQSCDGASSRIATASSSWSNPGHSRRGVKPSGKWGPFGTLK